MLRTLSLSTFLSSWNELRNGSGALLCKELLYFQTCLPYGQGIKGLAGSLLNSPILDFGTAPFPKLTWHLLPALPWCGLTSGLCVLNSFTILARQSRAMGLSQKPTPFTNPLSQERDGSAWGGGGGTATDQQFGLKQESRHLWAMWTLEKRIDRDLG